jgi:hypothetical protein
VSPRIDDVEAASSAGEMKATSSVVNASRPSLRRISPTYDPERVRRRVDDEDRRRRASSVNDQSTSAASGFRRSR